MLPSQTLKSELTDYEKVDSFAHIVLLAVNHSLAGSQSRSLTIYSGLIFEVFSNLTTDL